ncbi:MAG: hypothetical protein XD94_1133, partial [Mesotoga prima]
MPGGASGEVMLLRRREINASYLRWPVRLRLASL